MGDRIHLEMEAVELLGIRVHRVGLAEMLSLVCETAKLGRNMTLGYVNAHVLDTAQRSPELKEFLDEADLVYPDGWGPVWAARLFGLDLGERMTGADWIWDLAALVSAESISIGMVGGVPGVSAGALDTLKTRFPDLCTAGSWHGFFDKHGPENLDVLKDIQLKDPKILLVGMGTPLQEKWVLANRKLLGDRVVWVVGALADYLSGRVRRAPGWMLEMKLEWLFRFLSEPKRLGARYLHGNLRLAATVLKELTFGPIRTK